MIKSGANIEEKGAYQTTPLMFAAAKNHNSQVTEVLLKAGANVNQKSGICKNGFSLSVYLLEKLANLKPKKWGGDTALILAAKENRNPEVVIALIKAGADVGSKNAEGKTALQYAQDNPQMKNTKALTMLRESLMKEVINQ
ncbi:MAG: ankyrin repeat domain-containing protein [Alphaproteobacteria bacterium]|nr:ankyrin repeat domain-containing protein [Alphaproteobacteria bacterium]